MATKAKTHVARAALVFVSASALGLIWMCASAPGSHDYYVRMHSLPTIDGQPLRAAVYANPAR
jgi:hypothetical protein